MASDVDDILEELHELLDDERYKFAWPTLSGIRDTIKEQLRVSERQQRAVSNIKASVTGSREDRPGWKRRYEGHK